MTNIDQAYNYRAVSNTVATSGVVGREILELLGDDGFKVVINLLPSDSEYAIKDEEVIIRQQGIEYAYLPIDFSAPTLEDYVKFKEILKKTGDRKVLIHCAANYRVSAFYSRYAIELGLWSAAEADNFMLSIWTPGDYPPWPEWLEQVAKDREDGKAS